MRKILILGVALVFSFVAVAANSVKLKDDRPDFYFVKKGDTLWDISSKYLNSPWLWPEIWHANPQVENPHLIYPGDQLKLVYIDGQSKVMVVRGDGTVKLSPDVRISALDVAIPAIPLEKINAFLTQSRILDNDILSGAPYVLAGDSGRIVSGGGDTVYARGEFSSSQKIYGVYRQGQAFKDPETEEVLGLEATDVATAKVMVLDGDVATLRVNSSNTEVRKGDRLLPFEERKVTATFFPSSPSDQISGTIMAVENGVSNIGSLDIVILNRGEREGLEEGHVLAIYKTGEVVRDDVQKELVQLPDKRAGLLMVFRTFDKMSYALVLEAFQALNVGDKVKNP